MAPNVNMKLHSDVISAFDDHDHLVSKHSTSSSLLKMLMLFIILLNEHIRNLSCFGADSSLISCFFSSLVSYKVVIDDNLMLM